MYLLQIEHEVISYEGWKKAFDGDPAGRKQSGVLAYRILRHVDNPNSVMIELEFETITEANNLLAALQKVFPQVEGKVVHRVKTRIAEIVEYTKP